MILRRDFLRSAVAAPLLGGLLPPVARASARLDPALVPPGGAPDPLVRLLEETPRDRLIEEVGARVRKGLAYDQVLAALFTAAVRNVQPRPVGFKFHAVLAVHAAHETALRGSDAERWLPIFWSLDYFKASQAEEQKKTGWTLPAVDEAKVPAPEKAGRALVEAFERWDVDAVDGPAIALARHASAVEAFEPFFRHSIRDFRDIGHKAIYAAGAWRLLQVVGWRHAEPVLRSLALALQYHVGESPAKGDLEPDRPWRFNATIVDRIPAGWAAGKPDGGATADLLAAAREADPEGMSRKVLALLEAGVSPRPIWDALFAAAGEILMRRTNILSIHALTTFNAMRFIFETSGSDGTRRLALLQAAAFLPLFRGRLERELRIDAIEPQEATLDEVLADVARDRASASRKVLGYLKAGGDAQALGDAARRLVFTKAQDAHDYKFSAAVLEDQVRLSPAWRDRFLAASVHYLKGPSSPDNGLLPRLRAALKG